MVMDMNNICKNCHAILTEPQGITTQAFCICCKRAHGGPLCGSCSGARNIYKELFEELDRARWHIINSGVDHELTYDDMVGVEELCSTLWVMSNRQHKKLKAEGKVE